MWLLVYSTTVTVEVSLLCSFPTTVLLWLGKMTKSLFIFVFLLSWTYYTEESAGKCHITSITQVTVTWQEVPVSHHIMSHDRLYDKYRKVVHRPYSSCISSIENLTKTLLSSLCQLLNKEQLALFQLGV